MSRPHTAVLSPVPRWVMLGCDEPDPEHPCRLIASAKLTRAELEMQYSAWRFAGPHSAEASLVCRMAPEGIVIIDGPSWQVCLDELMRIWSPDTGKRQAITTGQRQVSGDGG